VKAIAVITNAEIIKEKISTFYSVEKERIYVINHRPSIGVANFKEFNETLSQKVKKQFDLPEKYIFYPAMYLPHKNHKYVIDTIKILYEKFHTNISAVFCGSDKGYLNKIKKYSNEVGQEKRMHFLDFVEDEYMPYLYINSLALVMPTFSGPTNIPPWEAFKLKIPVFYSDIHNIKKVYKDSVFYIDPYDPSTLAKGIIEIIKDDQKKSALIKRGSELFNSVNEKEEFDQFLEIVKKRRKIKDTWEFKN